MLLAETKTAVLTIPAGWRAFEARRPTGAGGGVAALVRSSIPAEEWRSEAADGVLWVTLHGVLAGSRTLAVGVCYHRPRRLGSTAEQEREEASEWYERRAAEWAAAVEAGWVPMLVGDLNAHTATQPDWPAWGEASMPRRSMDRQLDMRGRLLLQFCCDLGARIANGRVPGDMGGTRTSYGVRGTANSVVDYAIVPAGYLPQVRALHVAEEPLDDHSSLTLVLEGMAVGGTAQHHTPTTDPCLMRFPRPRDDERLEAAVEGLVASPMLPALVAAAQRASTPAEVAAVAQQRCLMVAAACVAAGIRQTGSAGSAGGRAAGSISAIPGHIEQRFGLRRLRATLRRERRRRGNGNDDSTFVKARRELQRATRRARQAQRDERAQRLERRFLTEHDAAGFAEAYRGPRAELPDWVLQEPEAVFAHFQALLDPSPPSTPPTTDAQALPAGPPGMGLEARRSEPEGPDGGRHWDEPHPEAFPDGSQASGSPARGREAVAEGAAATAAAAAAAAEAVPPDTPPAHPQSPPTPTPATHDAAALRARMDAPFTAEEVLELAGRTPLRKSVVGPLAPWLLKPACRHLAPLIAAEFNAWRRVGCLPPADALSAIALVPKIATPLQPADFRGIAVGALLAKLYAAALESRVSAHAEAAGVHAEGQYGFRRGRSTEQAVAVLRTLVDSSRQQRRRLGHTRLRAAARRSGGKGQLWAAFIDFQQAYDRVPREQLWARLEQMGYGGEWLRAVRAIYAAVPMTVSAPGLEGRTISSTQGLKQGCPLSPTLFALYIADFEGRILAAAQRGEQLDLPLLAGQAVPPLLYADDMALLATSAAGLQRQLDLLQRYCAERGLTVNLKKTKAMLLAGADSEEAAMAQVQRAGLTYAGQRLEGTTQFKYLGVVFHCTQPLGESAAGARAAVARYAAAAFEGRCAELGLEAARLLLLLYHSLVDSTLSYCAAAWAPGLAMVAARRPIRGSSGLSDAERQHHRTIRRLLGLPQRAPTATILAEAGEVPLFITWLVSAARLWHRMLEAPPGSLLRRAVEEGRRLAAECAEEPRLVPRAAELPWAAQLQRAMQEAGVAGFSLQDAAPPAPADVRQAALQHYLQRVAAEAQQPGASRMHHYFGVVRPECLEADSYGRPAYIEAVRERYHRRALAELRTGVHWGAEETDRLLGAARRPPAERHCPHCARAGLPGRAEDTHHIVFECTLYADLRKLHKDLFPPAEPESPETDRDSPRLPAFAQISQSAARATALSAFLAGSGAQTARFTGDCRRRARRYLGLPP